MAEDVAAELGAGRLPPTQRAGTRWLRQVCILAPSEEKIVSMKRMQVAKVGRLGTRQVRTIEQRDLSLRKGLESPPTLAWRRRGGRCAVTLKWKWEEFHC